MFKRGAILLGVLTIILMAMVPSFANDYKTSIDLTSVGIGARQIGLGGAFAGVADDASAIFANPAGLGLQKRLSFVSMSTQILSTVNYQLAGASYPTQWGTFGIGYMGATAPAGDYTYVVGGITREGGAINYTNQMLVLSYGLDISDYASDMFNLEGEEKVKGLSFGANIKALSSGFSGGVDGAATGFETDLGLLFIPTAQWSFGATLQNVCGSLNWNTDEIENMPAMLKLGSAFRFVDNVTFLLDADISMNDIVGAGYHGGVEWQATPMFAVRAGFDQKPASINDDTVGAVTAYSLGLGVMMDGFRFDYAFKQDPTFTEFSTHYFSFCYTGNEMEIAANPENASEAKIDNTLDENKDFVPQPQEGDQNNQ